MKKKNIKYLLSFSILLLIYSGLVSQDFPIDLTKLGAGDSIVVSFQATVDREMPPEIDIVNCQTTVTAGDGLISVVSDDPRTMAPDDPTQAEIAIPTMSQWGLIILGLLLINFAVIGLPERQKPILIKTKV